MNIQSFAQGLAVEIMQNVQTTLPMDPDKAGDEFEAMLRQQSKTAETQRREEQTQKKPADQSDKKTDKAEKPEEEGTNEQEIPEDGYQVAAGLVTSQPVVHFELLSGMGQEFAGEDIQIPQVQNGENLIAEVTAPAAPQTADTTPVMEAPVEVPGEQVQETLVRPEAPVLPEETRVDSQVVPQETQPEAMPVREENQTAQKQAVVHDGKPAVAETSEKQPEDAQVTEAWTQEQPVFHRETAAPVKVAENYETMEPQDLDLLQQVGDQLHQAIQQGQSSVEIQLSPANLGKVIVEITRSGDGTLSIVMSAATEKAATVLRQHSTGLQHALMNTAQAPVQVEVQQPQQTEDSNPFLNPDGQNRQQHQQQQQEHRHKAAAEDFLQQLRLGLVGLEDAGE